MKILVTNAHSVRNSGDAVLLQVTLQEIATCFQDAEVVVALNDPDGYVPFGAETAVGSFVYWFKSNRGERGAWRKLNLLLAPLLIGWAILVALGFRMTGRSLVLTFNRERRTLLQAYLDADMVISCPGNFLLSGSGLGLPFFLTLFAFGYGWLVGKPLYMMQQTIGPFRRRWQKVILRWLLERVRVVAVRDERSREILEEIGLNHPRCFVLPDAAFLYKGTGNPMRLLGEKTRMQRAGRPHIGLTIIDFALQNRFFTGQQAYENAIVTALSAFVRRHGGVVFLFPQVCGPSQAEDDRIPSRRVARRLTENSISTVAVESIWTPDELKCAYGQMDIFVGTRLHSNIFALTAGTPVVAIAYYYKTYGIMQMFGLSEWVLDIRTVTDQELEQHLEALWLRRTELHQYLGAKLPQLQKEAHRTCELIREDFESKGKG